MSNGDVLKTVTSYLHSVMESRGLTEKALSEACENRAKELNDKNLNITEKTIHTMFTRPSSITLSTLLKVCDTLDLNLASIFRTIENEKSGSPSAQSRLILDSNNPAYRGYFGDYDVWFLPTSLTQKKDSRHSQQPKTEGVPETELVHGDLTFRQSSSSTECEAYLRIHTGDYDANNNEFIKEYAGTLTYSSLGIMFCNLTSGILGDMWCMVFNHANLNNHTLSCVVGCAATSSSGKVRNPAVHRFCITSKTYYRELPISVKKQMEGLLRMQNNVLYISESELKAFQESSTYAQLDPVFRESLEMQCTNKNRYYRIVKSKLKDEFVDDAYSVGLSELCLHTAMEKVYQVREEDSDTVLYHILAPAMK